MASSKFGKRESIFSFAGSSGYNDIATTIQKDSQPHEQSLTKRLDQYMAQHGVETQMNSNYMLNAFTIRGNDGNYSKMVLVMDAEKADGKHVQYTDYVNKTSSNEDMDHHEVMEDRHFEYVVRASHDSVIASLNKRTFSRRYKHSLPVISKDQNFIGFPRFSYKDKSANLGVIDIYNCSDEQFWLAEHEVDLNDGFYECSLKLREQEMQNFQRLIFSTNSKYMCVLSKRYAYIYDL